MLAARCARDAVPLYLRPVVFLDADALGLEKRLGVRGIDRQHAIDRGPAAHHALDQAARGSSTGAPLVPNVTFERSTEMLGIALSAPSDERIAERTAMRKHRLQPVIGLGEHHVVGCRHSRAREYRCKAERSRNA